MTVQSALADRCTPLLKSRMREVFARLPLALAGDEEAIHQMRVSGRRLRVALPLLAKKPEGRRVRQALVILRQLTRAGGNSRDLDVCVTLFEERLRDLAPPSAEQGVLRRRLRGARTRSRSRMVSALLDLEIARLRRHLRAVASWRAEGLFPVLLRVRETRDIQGAALLSALEALGGSFEPVGLHRLRIRTRRLRYMAELQESLRGQPCQAPAMFRGLQEQLGSIRDTYVLSQWLAGQAAAARARHQEGLAGAALSLSAWFLGRSQEHHRAFLERNPAQLVAQALEAMGQGRSAA